MRVADCIACRALAAAVVAVPPPPPRLPPTPTPTPGVGQRLVASPGNGSVIRLPGVRRRYRCDLDLDNCLGDLVSCCSLLCAVGLRRSCLWWVCGGSIDTTPHVVANDVPVACGSGLDKRLKDMCTLLLRAWDASQVHYQLVVSVLCKVVIFGLYIRGCLPVFLPAACLPACMPPDFRLPGVLLSSPHAYSD